MGKFKKGLLVGALLGAGLTWLNTTVKGKKIRDNILKHTEAIYPEIKQKVMTSGAWQTMTKSKYVKIVSSHVSAYAKKYSLPPALTKMIENVITAEWNNLQTMFVNRQGKKDQPKTKKPIKAKKV